MIANPLIFGILNITDDSFSDGGRYLNRDGAVSQAEYLHKEGAAVIDIGPASSNPNSAPVPAEIQIQRLSSVWSSLKQKGLLLSADVCVPEVQLWAAENGADFINDINGFKNPETIEALVSFRTQLIVMHSLQQNDKADTRNSDPDSVMDSIRSFFSERIGDLLKAGISQERIVLDPGLGFFLGSNSASSVLVLKKLKSLKMEFPFRFLVSPARKSFLGEITGKPVNERDAATLAAELFAVYFGEADMIRTHSPGPLTDALKVWNQLNI